MSRSPSRGLLARAALVAAGGVVGTAARWGLEVAAPTPAGAFPWTTFAINVAGSFVLGLLLETLVLRGPDEGRRRRVRLGVGTGALGGFTTYSTFVAETDRLLAGGAVLMGAGYAVVSILAGVSAAVAGILLARRGRAGGDT